MSYSPCGVCFQVSADVSVGTGREYAGYATLQGPNTGVNDLPATTQGPCQHSLVRLMSSHSPSTCTHLPDNSMTSRDATSSSRRRTRRRATGGGNGERVRARDGYERRKEVGMRGVLLREGTLVSTHHVPCLAPSLPAILPATSSCLCNSLVVAPHRVCLCGERVSRWDVQGGRAAGGCCSRARARLLLGWT